MNYDGAKQLSPENPLKECYTKIFNVWKILRMHCQVEDKVGLQNSFILSNC